MRAQELAYLKIDIIISELATYKHQNIFIYFGSAIETIIDNLPTPFPSTSSKPKIKLQVIVTAIIRATQEIKDAVKAHNDCTWRPNHVVTPTTNISFPAARHAG
jgi:hypothetical protein